MYSLPIPLLFAMTIVACCVRSVFSGCYSKKVSADNYHTWLFGLIQSIFCLASIIGIFLVSGGLGSFSPLSIGLGILIGAADILSLVTMLKAMSVGPFSYTVIITSLGSVIPTLSGYFFGEKVSLVQYVGVALMIACLLLSPENSNGGAEKKASAKWLTLSIDSALCCGTIGVVQKIHQTSPYCEERAAMLVGAFAFSLVFAAFTVMIEKKKLAAEAPKVERKILIGLPAIAGFVFAFQHSINLFLSGAMPAVIVFPLVNLLPMIASMTIGFIIFREKLTAKRWLGLACGIASSILVSGVI